MRVPSPAQTPGESSDPAISTRTRPCERIEIRLMVLLEVADVGPVVRRNVAAELLPVAQHLREDVLGEVVDLSGRHVLEDLGLEDVDPGVDRVGEDLAPRRLLEEPFDPAVLAGDDDAELERIVDSL